MKFRKIVACLLTAIMLTGMLLTGCGTNSDKTDGTQATQTTQSNEPTAAAQAQKEDVKLIFWDNCGDSQDADSNIAIIKNFNDANTGIVIERQTMDTDSLRNTIKPAMLSGSGPDIFSYEPSEAYLGVLADAGLALDITPYVKKDQFLPVAFSKSTYNDKIYGICNQLEVLAIYYNKKIFKDLSLEVPKTYDEFIEVCKTIKKNNIIPLQFNNKDAWPGWHMYSIWYGAFAGRNIIDKALNGEIGFDDQHFVNALDSFAALVKDGYTNPSPNAIGYDDGNKEFFAGKAAMTATGTWLLGDVYKNLGEDAGIFVLPPATEDVPYAPAGGLGDAIVISAKTKYVDESMKFVEHYFSPESAKLMIETNGYVPPVEIDLNSLNVNPLFKEFIKLLDYSDSFSYPMDLTLSADVNEVTKNTFQQLTDGSITGKDASAKIQEAYLKSKK